MLTMFEVDLFKVLLAFLKFISKAKDSRVTGKNMAVRFPCFPKTVFRGFVDVCSRPSQPSAVLTLTLLGSVKGSKHEA
jgi:hypothetical protein